MLSNNKMNIMVCGHIKDSYQPGHLPSLIKVFNGVQWIAENPMLPMIISLPKHFHLYRDFVKVCSRLARGAYMYLVMIKIVFSKVHHKNICCV